MPQLDVLAEHLETCPDCLAQAQTLSPTDTLAKTLSEASEQTEGPDAAVVARLIEKLKTLAAAPMANLSDELSEDSLIGSTPDALDEDLTASGGWQGSELESELLASHEGSDHEWGFLSPPQAADEIGRLGSYRILQVLGRGGMGVVFRAEDLNLKRIVALKAMLPTHSARPSAKSRFLREAQTAASIKHDHIVTIHQVGEDRGVPFLAMEFLLGEPLDARIKREQKLPIPEVLRIGREVAEGLAAAQEEGLIHRDIKPANVWLESRSSKGAPRVKILDFGLARSTADNTGLTQMGTIMGTPSYMAPEQARGKTVDGRADLWSLGVMLYEMTNGRRPFVGDNAMAILTSLAMDEPTPPNLINIGMPQGLSDLIVRLLSKAPEHRPASAQAVAEELLRLQAEVVMPIVEAMPARGSADVGRSADNTMLDPWQDLDDATHVEPGTKSKPKVATVSPKSKPNLKRPPIKASRRPLLFAILAGLLIIGGGVGAYQLVFKTIDGTLIVEVDDDAKITFEKGELRVFGVDGKESYTLRPSDKNKSFPPGEYTIDVVGPNGLKLSTKEFKIENGKKTPVRVTLAKPDAVVKKDPPKADPKADPDRNGAAYILSMGGTVMIKEKGQERQTAAVGDLPRRAFELTYVHSGNNPKVNDAGLAIFKDCKNLTYLNLHSSQVSDAGLAYFKDCKNLAELHLGVTQVSDVGLALFKNCNLTVLDLAVTKVSDAGLGYFKDCKNLKQLGLHFCQVSDVGLAHFKDCKNLTAVHLYNTQVTDAGMVHFKDCKSLTYLNLNSTPVSDAGMVHFKDCKGLLNVSLLKTRVTAAKIEELKKALPQCRIEWDGGTISPTDDQPGGFALEFDGKSSLVEIPTLSRDDLGPITIEAFVTVAESRRGRVFVQVNGKEMVQWYGWENPIVENEWVPNCLIEGFKFADGTPSLVRGKRVHLAVQVNEKVIEMFLDGKKINSREIQPKPNNGDRRGTLIGTDTTRNVSFFSGTLAEIRISKVMRYKDDFSPAVRHTTDKDTLALYHGDEGQGDVLKDSSGNGHHGKIVGAKWVKSQGGGTARARYALEFDYKQRIASNSLPIADSLVCTVEAWVEIAESKVDNITGIIVSGRHGYIRFANNSISFYSFHGHAQWGETVVPNRLYHIAGINDGKERHLYIDGKFVGLSPDAGLLDPDKPIPQITMGGLDFKGKIYGARVSTIPRYTKDFTPARSWEADKDTLALYRFDEGQGDELRDSSGNGNHIKIVGPKWVKVAGVVSGDPDRDGLAWALSSGGYARFVALANGKEVSIRSVEELPKTPFILRSMNVNRNPAVTDGTLAVFKGIKSLTALQISNSKATNASLAYFKDCKKLEQLQLHATGIDDAGLAQIEGFPALRLLNLKQTAVSEAAVKALAAKLPYCTIQWNGGVIIGFARDFEKEAIGTMPKGWTSARTGTGEGSVWTLVEDKTAPRGSTVLAQTAESPETLFNVCVADDTSFTDVEVTVAFKAMQGKKDQGGGVVWRYVDNNNYYIARFNPLEDNYRLYKVVDGKRIQLATKEAIKAPAGEWHTLAVRMKGNEIVCHLNGKPVLEAKDDSFTKPGKVGLWTKADAQTYFDDFQVKEAK